MTDAKGNSPQIDYDELRKVYPVSPEPYIGGENSGKKDLPDEVRANLGSRRVPKLSNVRFPDADPIVAKFTEEYMQHQVENTCNTRSIFFSSIRLRRMVASGSAASTAWVAVAAKT